MLFISGYSGCHKHNHVAIVNPGLEALDAPRQRTQWPIVPGDVLMTDDRAIQVAEDRSSEDAASSSGRPNGTLIAEELGCCQPNCLNL
jgi:hypothetical protein